ncbi:hypothetical protein BB561_003072 [Smittium simulii]|uniref:Uncharacterized protein n=1 Tax=Smittium simulii TaxID=133385 RepID=A0A2T9YN53_9FUNG|nr:hypothetical protein BB561_003072 [Smittium simulii]
MRSPAAPARCAYPKVLAPASRILGLLASTQTASLSEYKKQQFRHIGKCILRSADSGITGNRYVLRSKYMGYFRHREDYKWRYAHVSNNPKPLDEQSEYNSENHIQQPTIKKIKVFFSSRKGITTKITRKKNLVTSFWTWAVLKSLEAFMTNSGDNISVRENAKSKALEVPITKCVVLKDTIEYRLNIDLI